MSLAATLVTVFVSSLIGSLHCVGMCGGLVTACVLGGCPAHTNARWRALTGYHIGRLVGYATLGGIAGVVGKGIDISGRAVGIEDAAAICAGVVILLMGIEQFGWISFPKSQRLTRWLSRIVGLAAKFSSSTRGLYFGCLTTFLPCGWLYAFVLMAAGMGGALQGALLMVAFWLGTVPALTAVGGLFQSIRERWLSKAPRLGAALLVILGVFTLAQTAFPKHSMSAPGAELSHQH